jgi:AcrR family transcriptional regulator
MVSKTSPGRPRASAQNRRDQIAKAAARLFSDLGYEKTTIRLVADAAEVDPKLVMHYFGNKQKLFVATMKVPGEVHAALTLLKLTPRASWGNRIADVIWLAQKSGAFQTLVGVLRASASEREAAEMFREFYLENMLLPMVSQLDVDNKEIRAMMMSSIMAGYGFTSEIIGLSQSLKLDSRKTKKLFANLIQTALTSQIEKPRASKQPK